MTAVYKLITGLHNGQGNFFSNIFTYQLTEAGSGHPFDYALALVDAWKLAIETDYLALMGSDVVLDFIQAKKFTSGGGPTASKQVGDTGTGSTASITTQLAADIAWVTASAINRFGHSFIGAVYDGALNQDFWDTAFLLKVVTFVNAMTTVLTLAGALGTATFGVYTKKTTTFNHASAGILKEKATVMNKRARPKV